MDFVNNWAMLFSIWVSISRIKTYVFCLPYIFAVETRGWRRNIGKKNELSYAYWSLLRELLACHSWRRQIEKFVVDWNRISFLFNEQNDWLSFVQTSPLFPFCDNVQARNLVQLIAPETTNGKWRLFGLHAGGGSVRENTAQWAGWNFTRFFRTTWLEVRTITVVGTVHVGALSVLWQTPV